MKFIYLTFFLCLSSVSWADDNVLNKIVFVNKYYNPEITKFESLADAMADDFGLTSKLSIDDDLAELVRLRISQIGKCSYCLITHHNDAIEKKIPASKVYTLISWENSDLFSKKEKAAISYAESLTYLDQERLKNDSENLKQFFNEKEIAELSAVIINMNVWIRLKNSQGATPMLK